MDNLFTKLDYYFPNWKVVSLVSLIVITLCVLGSIGTYKAVQNNRPTGTPTITQTPYIIVKQPVTEIVQEITQVVSYENNYTERQVVVPQDRVVFSDNLVLATVPIPVTVIVQQWSTVNVPVTVIVSLCHASYSVCLPIVDDLNCDGIPFDNFLVFGEDVYNLDSDNDGIACEVSITSTAETNTPTTTSTLSNSPTVTVSPSYPNPSTYTPTKTPTDVPTNTPTRTPTYTPTYTPTPTITVFSMPTITVPPTSTSTFTPPPSATFTIPPQ